MTITYNNSANSNNNFVKNSKVSAEIIEENGIKYKVTCNEYGTIYWYKYGTNILDREDGPAVEYPDGTKYWCKEGLYHREDGPAIEYFNGDKEYWLNDEPLKDIKTDEELMIKLLLE